MYENRSRKLIFLIFIIALILIGIGIYKYFDSLKFRVVSTNPSTGNVGTLSPFLKVNFNKPLSTKNISVSASSGTVTGFKAKGETLTFNLKYPLSSSHNYTVEINKIYDTSGDELINLTYTFKPKYISFANLPSDQQKTLVNSQDQNNTPGANTNFINTDALVNDGMSTTQLVLLEKYLSEYAPSAKTITIDTSSIGIYAAPSPYRAMFKFNLAIDGTNYSAQAPYMFLDDLTLTLFNSSGTQVFTTNS